MRIYPPQPGDIQQGHRPENVDDFSVTNCTQIFEVALAQARAYARTLGYDNLTHKPSGVRSRDIFGDDSLDQAGTNPIEAQKVFLHFKDGSKTRIGMIVPEQDHLRTLKSSRQLFEELKEMIDRT